MKIFRFLTFSLCALLLLSGCDYLSGFKEIDISQTGISKVCDKKHKLKYPEIVPAYSSWIGSIKEYKKEDLLKITNKRRAYLLSRNKCYPNLVKCYSKGNYEIEPIVILAENDETNQVDFTAFPPSFTPQTSISGFYGKLIGTYDIRVGIYNRSGMYLDLKSAQLWIVRGYKSIKNKPCNK